MNRFLIVLSILSISCLAGARDWQVPGEVATIQAAIDGAGPGDVVVIAAGVWTVHDIVLYNGVSLRGATGNPADVVLDAQGLGRVIDLRIDSSPVAVSALTLRGGAAVRGGGLSFSLDESPEAPGYEDAASTFTDLVFENNAATEDGGGFWRSGGLGGMAAEQLFTRCVFRNNTAGRDGGAFSQFADASCNARLRDCVFEDNASGRDGGAIHLFGAMAAFENCRIASNTATGSGGGIRADRFSRCNTYQTDILDNAAADGGAYYGRGSALSARMELTRFSGNAAPHAPACYMSMDGILNLICCDIEAGDNVDGWLEEIGDIGEYSIVYSDENCGVANEHRSWGAVKSLY